MIRRRAFLRPEGWYYCFVIAFVIGGSVLRSVNLLVALAGLMVAALILHWQMVLRCLSGVDLVRSIPARLACGDTLEVEVTATHRATRGASWALEYHDVLQRVDPPDDDPATEISLLFPHVPAGKSVTRRYRCELTRRGVYRFGKASVASRYPLGLVEAWCFLGMPDRLVVYPRIGQLTRRWQVLIEADLAGQQNTKHQQGISEGDFYALREWRNGDSRRWIHWRTSAKMGTLAVRQFEQRRSSDVTLLLDLWQPAVPTDRDRVVVEQAIAFAATAAADMSRHGGSRLCLAVASREAACWAAAASPLFTQELLEHLAVCRASHDVRLVDTVERMAEASFGGSRLLVLSTRPREAALEFIDRRHRDGVQWRLLEQATWLNGAVGEFQPYFSPDASRSGPAGVAGAAGAASASGVETPMAPGFAS